VVQDNQRGIDSPAYEPGPYAPEDERGVEQFVAWYCAAMREALPAAEPVRLIA
jgi:Rieske 2Fe-2S family protein